MIPFRRPWRRFLPRGQQDSGGITRPQLPSFFMLVFVISRLKSGVSNHGKPAVGHLPPFALSSTESDAPPPSRAAWSPSAAPAPCCSGALHCSCHAQGALLRQLPAVAGQDGWGITRPHRPSCFGRGFRVLAVRSGDSFSAALAEVFAPGINRTCEESPDLAIRAASGGFSEAWR